MTKNKSKKIYFRTFIFFSLDMSDFYGLVYIKRKL